MVELPVDVDIWSCFCWMSVVPLFGFCCLLWVLGECGSCGFPGIEGVLLRSVGGREERGGLGAKAESSFGKDPRESCAHRKVACSCKWVSCRLVVVPHEGAAVSAAVFGGVPGNGGSCPFYTSDTGLWESH